MNLAELSRLDIQNLQKLDYNKLLRNLAKRPDLMIAIGLVVATLFFSATAFQRRRKELTSLKQEIETLGARLKVMNNYEDIKKQLSDFQTQAPAELMGDDFIKTVTDIAVSHNVQIESYSPAKKQSSSLYDLTSIVLNLSAEYKNVWTFINDIEKSKYSIRIENWTGNMDADTRTTTRRRISMEEQSQQPWVNVQVEIASINLKK